MISDTDRMREIVIEELIAIENNDIEKLRELYREIVETNPEIKTDEGAEFFLKYLTPELMAKVFTKNRRGKKSQ